jgi:hypothetical protein
MPAGDLPLLVIVGGDMVLNILEKGLDSIDRATLTPLVRRVLGSETVEIVGWHRQRIHGGAGLNASVHRFAGNGRDEDTTRPWSFILKAIRASSEADDPSALGYWKREPLAYKSGLLEDLPGDVAAPRCFSVIEKPDGEIWLWLEDIRDEIGPHWTLEHYGLVARQLGQFNGAYLVGRPSPSWPWLSSGWLHAYVAQAAQAIALLRDSVGRPLIHRWLAGNGAEALFHLWAERETLFTALGHLPSTFCHLDAFRRNLFIRHSVDGRNQMVAIDWAYAGTGTIGHEIAPLTMASIVFFEIEVSRGLDLDEIVYESYLDGLRDAGWHGDPRMVRFGYLATVALRYHIGNLAVGLPLVLNENMHPSLEQTLGRSVEELIDFYAEVTQLLLRLEDEMWKLIDYFR